MYGDRYFIYGKIYPFLFEGGNPPPQGKAGRGGNREKKKNIRGKLSSISTVLIRDDLPPARTAMVRLKRATATVVWLKGVVFRWPYLGGDWQGSPGVHTSP